MSIKFSPEICGTKVRADSLDQINTWFRIEGDSAIYCVDYLTGNEGPVRATIFEPGAGLLHFPRSVKVGPQQMVIVIPQPDIIVTFK